MKPGNIPSYSWYLSQVQLNNQQKHIGKFRAIGLVPRGTPKNVETLSQCILLSFLLHSINSFSTSFLIPISSSFLAANEINFICGGK